VKRKSYISISQIIAILVAGFGIANLLTNNYIFNLLSLIPSKVAIDLQFWRVLSFSFIPGTVEGSLLFAFTFWFIAPLLEERFNRVTFPIIILLITLLQGIGFSLFFWKSPISFAGSESLSFFVLTMFTLSEMSKKTQPQRLFGLPAMSFVTLTSMLWLSAVLIHFSMTSEALLYNSIFSASYGIIISLAMYLQIRLTHSFKVVPQDTPNPKPRVIHDFEPQEVKSHERNAVGYRMLDNQIDDMFMDEDEDDDFYSEDKLNKILDKMLEYGNDSLSPFEKRYLKEYSIRINR
jgi:membrane associated rhomboid family serine protease